MADQPAPPTDLVQVGWEMCTDGRLVRLDGDGHEGLCPDCAPVYVARRNAQIDGGDGS